MENEAMMSKDIKVEIPSHDSEILSSTSKMVSNGQESITKYSCLCSPTTHAGSFRCRLHRAPTLHRSKSIDSTAGQDSQSKVTPSNNNIDQ